MALCSKKPPEHVTSYAEQEGTIGDLPADPPVPVGKCVLEKDGHTLHSDGEGHIWGTA